MNFVKTKTTISLSFIASVIFICCSPSTKIEKTWTDPSFTSGSVPPFKKVLVIANLKDESSRRIAEDKMVASLKNVTGVPSYSYLQPGDTARASVDEKLKNDGFDGIVVMRLTAVDKSLSYVPGTTYGGWYGWYGGGYSNDYYREDKTFYVETNLYSLTSDKLLWSGTTSTVNPSKFDRTLDDVISSLKSEMQKQGLLKS